METDNFISNPMKETYKINSLIQQEKAINELFYLPIQSKNKDQSKFDIVKKELQLLARQLRAKKTS